MVLLVCHLEMSFLLIVKFFIHRACQGFQVACKYCVDVRFCSEECLLQAEESYHPFECQANTKNITKYFEDVLNNVRLQFPNVITF